MSLQYPYRDIAMDAIRGFLNKPCLIITDGGVPLRIFPNGSEMPTEFVIYTTAFSVCDQFGARSQRALGYMCHGITPMPVKVPYIGQPIFFHTPYKNGPTFSGHKIARIYTNSIDHLVRNPMLHIKQVFHLLSQQANPVVGASLRITNQQDSSLDQFIRYLLGFAVYTSGGHLTLDQEATKIILDTATRHFKLQASDLEAIWASGLIYEDAWKRIVISDALFALFMEAIHRNKPMATSFDSQGILQVN